MCFKIFFGTLIFYYDIILKTLHKDGFLKSQDSGITLDKHSMYNLLDQPSLIDNPGIWGANLSTTIEWVDKLCVEDQETMLYLKWCYQNTPLYEMASVISEMYSNLSQMASDSFMLNFNNDLSCTKKKVREFTDGELMFVWDAVFKCSSEEMGKFYIEQIESKLSPEQINFVAFAIFYGSVTNKINDKQKERHSLFIMLSMFIKCGIFNKPTKKAKYVEELVKYIVECNSPVKIDRHKSIEKESPIKVFRGLEIGVRNNPSSKFDR